MSDTEVENAAEVELLNTAVTKIKQGEVDLDAIVEMVAKGRTPVSLPEVLPLPATITDEERAALEQLPEVFGTVVPEERRTLLPEETSLLLIERGTLMTIEKMAEKRKSDIRTTVLNHNDVRFEQEHTDDEGNLTIPEDVERDKDGHYIVKGELRAEPGFSKRFSCETKSGKAGIDPKVIQALADDPDVDWITHEDYLAMTEQVRQFSPERAFLHLKKKPELVRAIREATVPGKPSISVNERKA